MFTLIYWFFMHCIFIFFFWGFVRARTIIQCSLAFVCGWKWVFLHHIDDPICKLIFCLSYILCCFFFSFLFYCGSFCAKRKTSLPEPADIDKNLKFNFLLSWKRWKSFKEIFVIKYRLPFFSQQIFDFCPYQV